MDINAILAIKNVDPNRDGLFLKKNFGGCSAHHHDNNNYGDSDNHSHEPVSLNSDIDNCE